MKSVLGRRPQYSASHCSLADYGRAVALSDLGFLLLLGIDRQIGLTARLTSALSDRRHPGYVQHPLW